MFQFLMDHKDIVLGLLFALSEFLALVPSIKANSVFQLVYNWLMLNKAQK